MALAEWSGRCVHPESARRSETAEDGNSTDTAYWCELCKRDYTHRSEQLPDYLHDLNAVRELEVKLCDMTSDEAKGVSLDHYVRILESVAFYEKMGAIGATAAQRCEALLRTIGKWKDE